ncbi:MAG: hypothetical protein ACE5PV_16400 [Candidatus Poribacteria bacterium]
MTLRGKETSNGASIRNLRGWYGKRLLHTSFSVSTVERVACSFGFLIKRPNKLDPGVVSDFGKMERIFYEHGVLKTCRIGEARITNARIRDIVRITEQYLVRDAYFLLTPESASRLRGGGNGEAC